MSNQTPEIDIERLAAATEVHAHVIDVREASEEEIAHGHVHGEGGHAH